MNYASSVFERNRRALELFSPRAAACLAQQLTSPIVLPPREPEWNLPGLSAADTVIVLGIGNGNALQRLLALAGVRLLLVEPDATRCRAVLERQDFSAALAAGRLHCLLIPTNTAVTREISFRECIAEIARLLHGVTGVLHFLTLTQDPLQTTFFQSVLAGVQTSVDTVEVLNTSRRDQASFDVTVISPCCAIFDDLAHCFNRLGLRTQLLRVPDVAGAWTAAESRAKLVELASAPSRLVIARNRSLFETTTPDAYPQPESLLPGQIGLWWWDVPNLASQIDLHHARGHARHFGFARDLLRQLPPHSEWLPPGARAQFADADPGFDAVQDIEVSFVGQSRRKNLHENLQHLQSVLQALGGSASALGRDLERIEGYVAMHRYLVQHEAAIRAAISQLVAAYPAHAYYLGYLLDMAVTGCFRIAAIEHLARSGVAVAIYGDDDWLQVPGVTPSLFRGLRDPADLPALYRRSRINLNLNFMQVSSTVNPKVLDIAAMGGVALTDARPELELLYPDPAARPFVFRSIEELPSRIGALLECDLTAHRRAVRDHTLNHHTLPIRAEWLARQFGLLS